MSEIKYGNCIICARTVRRPKGNWNKNRVTLCKRGKCRKLRKSQMQKRRRKQKKIKAVLETGHGKKDSRRKTKFFGGIAD